MSSRGFLHNKHPRYLTQFASLGRRQPFFSKVQCTCALENADLAKLGDLIRVEGFLLQTKVYLFWKNMGHHRLIGKVETMPLLLSELRSFSPL